ncbi:MAG: MarC family protein, partial [Nitriliruptoraceae bacterium]
MDTLLVLEVAVTMFVIMDPVGNVPIFLSVTRRLSVEARNRAALIAVVAASLVIVVFATIGRQVLGYLGVSVPALQAAGGLLLLLVALELLTGRDVPDRGEPAPGDHVAVAMVPLGTPLLAGPGAIVATIVFVTRAEDVADHAMIATGI